MPAANQKPSLKNPKTSDETIKETFESIVIAFILAFVFRAYVVEAFVIPTGSMAPTLLGQHVAVRCEQCGYRWTFDASYAATVGGDLSVECPMCRFGNPVPAQTATLAGDRLLVHKYIYQLAEPRRWDVVVFRNPQRANADGTPGPETNYIKRLAGLPGERLHLLDGNVYVAPGSAPAPAAEENAITEEKGISAFSSGDGWRIARKTDPAENRHWEEIQRAVWQPIYHSTYLPLDDGWRGRSPSQQWSCPWVPVGERGASAWDVGNAEDGWRRGYRYHSVTGWSGTLRFDWSEYHGRGTEYAYNLPRNGRYEWDEPIEDVRLAVTVVPDAIQTRVSLATTARLSDGAERLMVNFGETEIYLTRQPLIDSEDGGRFVEQGLPDRFGSVRIEPFVPGQPTSLELWFVDQEALVFVNGEVVLRHAFDLPLAELMDRPPPPPTPEVTISLSGSPATLYDVQLDRDLYYGVEQSSRGQAPHGALRRSGDAVVPAPPMVIEPDEFFVLGDNSPISEDSRFWRDVDPWVERDFFPMRLDAAAPPPIGVVPRGLMVGRAFFVYYPAPYPVGPRGRQVLPNFGDMRFVW